LIYQHFNFNKDFIGKKYETIKGSVDMSNKEKMSQILLDLQETLKHDEIEDTLTLLGMLRNAEQLEEWLSK
jgi:ribosomal protein L30/L7E